MTPVVIDIGWGARSRVVNGPSSALSAAVTLTNAAPKGGDFVFTVDRDATLPAHTTAYTSPTSAKVGTWQCTVRFYAQADGAGAQVAIAQAAVTLAPDGTGIGNISTTSTIASVQVPTGQSVNVGQAIDLAFTAKDGQGNLVAVTPGSAFITVLSGADKLQIVNGQVDGTAVGAATVTVSVDGVQSAPMTVQVIQPSPNTASFLALFEEGSGNSLLDSVSGQSAVSTVPLTWVNDPVMGWSVDFTGKPSVGIPVNLPNSAQIFKTPPAAYTFAAWMRPTDAKGVTGKSEGAIMDTDTVAAFDLYPNFTNGGTITVSPRDDSNKVHLAAFSFQTNPIPVILVVVTVQQGQYQVYANLNNGVPFNGLKPQFASPLICNVANTWGAQEGGPPNMLYYAGTKGGGYTPHAVIGALGIWNWAFSQTDLDAFYKNPFGKVSPSP